MTPTEKYVRDSFVNLFVARQYGPFMSTGRLGKTEVGVLYFIQANRSIKVDGRGRVLIKRLADLCPLNPNSGGRADVARGRRRDGLLDL